MHTAFLVLSDPCCVSSVPPYLSFILQVDKAMEEEKERRINSNKSEYDKEKKEAHEKLIVVQEDLLKTFRKMKASYYHSRRDCSREVLLINDR